MSEHCDVCGLSDGRHRASEHTDHLNKAAEAERIAAHGGSVALPWSGLTESQRDVWRDRVALFGGPS